MENNPIYTNPNETGLAPVKSEQTAIVPFGTLVTAVLRPEDAKSSLAVAKALNGNFGDTITQMIAVAQEYPAVFTIDRRIINNANSRIGVSPESFASEFPSFIKALSGNSAEKLLTSTEMAKHSKFVSQMNDVLNLFPADKPAVIGYVLCQIALDNSELMDLGIDIEDTEVLLGAHEFFGQVSDHIHAHDVEPKAQDFWVKNVGQLLNARTIPYRKAESEIQISSRKQEFNKLKAEALMIRDLMRNQNLDSNIREQLEASYAGLHGTALSKFAEFADEVNKIWGNEGNTYDGRAYMQDPNQGTSMREPSEIYDNQYS